MAGMGKQPLEDWQLKLAAQIEAEKQKAALQRTLAQKAMVGVNKQPISAFAAEQNRTVAPVVDKMAAAQAEAERQRRIAQNPIGAIGNALFGGN